MVTDLTNGGFVIAWDDFREEYDENGSGGTVDSDVRAQVFNASGAKQGGEFLVNTRTVDFQENPTITGLDNGDFVVAWIDTNIVSPELSTTEIKAQRFSADGSKQGGEFQVNTLTAGTQVNPTITGLANGDFVVSWENDGGASGQGISGQVFSAAGAKLGAEFLVNTPTVDDLDEPKITGLTNGGFVVTWVNEDETETSSGIKAQIFSANGAKLGNEFLVNIQTAGDRYDPTITGLANGGFVVTWENDPSATGETDIKAQVFSADGTKQGGEFLVNTVTTGSQQDQSIASLANGGFVVTWEDDNGTPGGLDIKAQIFDLDDAIVVPIVSLFDDTANTRNLNVLNPSDFPGPYNNAGGGNDVVTLPGTASGIALWSLQTGFNAGAGDDRVFGGAGDEIITGGTGNDVLNGGKGVDTAIFSASRSATPVTRNSNGTVTVASAADGTDTVSGIELFQFADGTFSFAFADPGAPRVANFTVGAGGWSSQDSFPRQVADVNGDGLADIVGFGQAGTLVSLGQAGGTFANPFTAVADFGAAQGWSSDNVFHREMADVNGDGRADIVGFGIAGVLVSLAQANGTFGAATLGSSNFNPANGWASQDSFARTLGDVNGDGLADIVGFGIAGTFVSLGTGTGSFGTTNLALNNFGKNQGWSSDNVFHREVGDVNGDGRADIVGFGIAGTLVALGQANGTFADATFTLDNFGTNQGWGTQDVFTRDLADVNGDGRDDVVGFGIAGTFIAYGLTNGTFSTAAFDLANFGRNQGWTSDNSFHRELADINGDGMADIIGFGFSGVFAATAFDGLVI